MKISEKIEIRKEIEKLIEHLKNQGGECSKRATFFVNIFEKVIERAKKIKKHTFKEYKIEEFAEFDKFQDIKHPIFVYRYNNTANVCIFFDDDIEVKNFSLDYNFETKKTQIYLNTRACIYLKDGEPFCMFD